MQDIKKLLFKEDYSFIKTLFYCGMIFFIFFNVEASFSQTNQLLRNDGPYIIKDLGEFRKIYVESGKLINEKYDGQPFTVVTDDGMHSFTVNLHSFDKPKDIYSAGDYSTLVLSDPHGDFESFYSILRAQNVINKEYKWTFGKNHLMVIGDVFDRGDDVLPIFWLIYKLEQEARSAGGQVHFLLGNHEEMVLRGDLRYITQKYADLSEKLQMNYDLLWNQDSELGRWLHARNVIQKIDDNLFVHAGISPKVIEDNWTLKALNDSTRTYLGLVKKERDASSIGKFLYGSEGPLWYRGMVRSEEKYMPLHMEDVQRIKDRFQANRIYVGHTMFPDVSSFFNNTVFDVNVKNSLNRKEGKSRGVVITKDGLFLVFDEVSKNSMIK